MEIINPETGEVFNALTSTEWEQKYFLHADKVAHQEIRCVCGFECFRGELIHETDIEQMHPANRTNDRCNLVDRSGCHITAFEKCPKCKRCLIADGQFIR